ncbi:hypothetical protein RQP46_006433 [Phenoliferia psychrophenolica]
MMDTSKSDKSVRTLLLPALLAAALLCYFTLAPDAFTPDAIVHYQARPDFHLAPHPPLERDKFAIVEPDGEEAVTVVAIHGLGDAPEDLPFVDGLADVFPFVRWVSPQAPSRNITVRGSRTFPAWFDISTFQDLDFHEDVASLVSSAQQIHDIIREERERMVKAGKLPRIVVAGFSQGAVMSLLVALTASPPVEAAILLSAYLPKLAQVESLASPVQRKTPIFWGHGAEDPFLTARKALEGVRALRTPPISMTDVTFKTYKGLEHYWDRHELEDVADWLEERLGWAKKSARMARRRSVDLNTGEGRRYGFSLTGK